MAEKRKDVPASFSTNSAQWPSSIAERPLKKGGGSGRREERRDGERKEEDGGEGKRGPRAVGRGIN